MATPSTSSIVLFLLLPTILAVASLPKKIDSQPWPWPWPCNCPQQNETRLHMYLHQFPALPNVPNPNEVNVINSNQPIGFGQTLVHDWTLTVGSDPNERIVGRVQGFHIQAGQTVTSWYTSSIIVFHEDRLAGSTLEVLGVVDPAKPDGQWSIMGGTGVFTNAQGSVKFTNSNSTSTDAVKELDIHVFYTPEAPTAV